MSESYFDPDCRAKVTVPVKRVCERREFFYDGDAPACEGTQAALQTDSRANADELVAHHSRQAKKK